MAKHIKRILVTGSDGFIGSHLVPFLKQHDYDVIGFDKKRGPEFNCAETKNLPKDIHALINLAAHIHPPSMDTVHVAEAVTEHCVNEGISLIHASSAAVYDPITEYGKHKKASENIIMGLTEHALILRFFNVFGDRGNGVIDRFIRQYNVDRTLTIHGDGTQRRDFIAVEDICEAILRGLGRRGIYDLGTGHMTSVRDLVEFFPLPVKTETTKGDPGVSESRARHFPSWWKPSYTDIPQYIHQRLRNAR